MEVKGYMQRIFSNFIYFVLALLVDPATVSDVSKYLFPIMVAYIYYTICISMSREKIFL